MCFHGNRALVILHSHSAMNDIRLPLYLNYVRSIFFSKTFVLDLNHTCVDRVVCLVFLFYVYYIFWLCECMEVCVCVYLINRAELFMYVEAVINNYR